MDSNENIIGSRIQYNDHFGTVRYVGPLEQQQQDIESNASCERADTKNEIYVGIEWDDSNRGKHDGSYQGKRYFMCSSETGGSFIPFRRCNFGISLYQAIVEKYRSENSDMKEEENLDVSDSHTVQIMFVGAKKARQKFNQLDRLATAAPRVGKVSSSGPAGELSAAFPSLRVLDLRYSLLTSWKDITNILTQLHLREIYLGHNHISDVPSHVDNCKNILLKELELIELSNFPNALDSLILFVSIFTIPSLHNLILSQNGITELIPFPNPIQLSSIHLIDLSNNSIEDWDMIIRTLGFIPSLQKLFLNSNKISSTVYRGSHDEETKKDMNKDISLFKNLTTLSLDDNIIDDMASIDSLNAFPSLEELRFQRNPISEDLGAAMLRSSVIARMARLKLFNRSEVRTRERLDAEKMYLRRCVQKYSENHDVLCPRFTELVLKHGPPISTNESKISSSGNLSANGLVNVTLISMDPESCTRDVTKKRLPLSMTVANLKMLLKRLYGLPPHLQTLTYRQRSDSSKSEHFPFPLDDDFKSLSFFGIQDDSDVIMERLVE